MQLGKLCAPLPIGALPLAGFDGNYTFFTL
jgi:hypothetical protein